MSAGICGPFKQGTDLGVSKRRKVKHALIATIPVPKWPAPGEQQEVDSEAPGDGDEKKKTFYSGSRLEAVGVDGAWVRRCPRGWEDTIATESAVG
jgi:hypothetical protein